MRVVSWNIERGYRPDEIVEELRELRGDVYLLYELDRGVRRTRGIDMFSRIEAGLGMPGTYVREFEEIDTAWRRMIPWNGPGGGEIGNAVFSRYDILDYRAVELPTRFVLRHERKTRVSNMFQMKKGCYKAQIFRIRTASGAITIAATHLQLLWSLWPHRKSQLDTIMRHVHDERIILAGDFNTVQGALRATLLRRPGAGEVRAMRAWLEHHALVDPFDDADTTCGRVGIRAKIDWIAGTKNLKVLSTRIGRTALSDHAWLAVDYDLSSTGEDTGSRS